MPTDDDKSTNSIQRLTAAADRILSQVRRDAQKKAIKVELPIVARQIGSLHRDVASATFPDGSRAEVSCGFGLGNMDMYVSIGGKRALAVDACPLVRALIDAAVDETRKKGGK